jgi:ribosome-associated translation inhibitor RaiA
MKLVIRFRDVAPTPELLDHVKHAIARVVDPDAMHSLRVTLVGELHGEEEWYRCRLEVGLRGAVRVLDAGAEDVFLAIDAAADRLEVLRDRVAIAA